jgi:RimJ/RimL family protein N-acetyltransferase
MRIRELRPSDIKPLASFLNSFHEEGKSDKDWGNPLFFERPTLKFRINRLKNEYKEVKNGNELYYVATEGKEVIGSCAIKKMDIPDSELSHVGVLEIRVNSKWRDKGIGTKLLKYTINKAKSKFEVISASILTINGASRHVFEKLGFKVWGTAPGYVKRGGRYIDIEFLSLRL